MISKRLQRIILYKSCSPRVTVVGNTFFLKITESNRVQNVADCSVAYSVKAYMLASAWKVIALLSVKLPTAS